MADDAQSQETAPDNGGIYALTADTIKHLDRGALAAAIDHAITQAVKDCLDRPADERKRTVSLAIDLTPVSETHGQVISCEGATGAYKVKLKIPDWESNKLDFGVKANGHLVFSSNSPKNHAQTTFLPE